LFVREGAAMTDVMYLDVSRAAKHLGATAASLSKVRRLLMLCRHVEQTVRRLTVAEGACLGEGIDPRLILKLERLAQSLERKPDMDTAS
jgi:hypothetical protein